MTTDLRHDLQSRLRRHLRDDELQVRELRSLTGGASRETWSATAHHSNGALRRLVLRRDPPGETRPTGVHLEAAAIRAAAKGGVPVPPLILAEDDPSVLGSAYLLTEHVDGLTLPQHILRDDTLASARRNLAADCGHALAAIHSIPVDDLPGHDRTDVLETIRRRYDDLGAARPALELGFRWLRHHRPAPGPPALVHGDCRLGNLIVDPDGLRAVLDWEAAHIGDAREDLGWLCIRAWRFRGPHPVGGFGSYADLLTAYHNAGGRPVDLAGLHWWQVLGTLTWGVYCLVQGHRHLSGERRSVELAAVGRRIHEQEYDLLRLIHNVPAGRPGNAETTPAGAG